MVTLISSSICLTYGKDSPPSVYIVRNVAWNDFIAQIASVPTDAGATAVVADPDSPDPVPKFAESYFPAIT